VFETVKAYRKARTLAAKRTVKAKAADRWLAPVAIKGENHGGPALLTG